MQRKILFLCTGNYYRSRFAEELFNRLAAQQGLGWLATSRALAIELGAFNFGPISQHVREALLERGIDLLDPVRQPVQVTEEDLAAADRVIALKEAEHRPYLTVRYPAWPDRVEYWNVHDLDKATPTEALASIEEQVKVIIKELK